MEKTIANNKYSSIIDGRRKEMLSRSYLRNMSIVASGELSAALSPKPVSDESWFECAIETTATLVRDRYLLLSTWISSSDLTDRGSGNRKNELSQRLVESLACPSDVRMRHRAQTSVDGQGPVGGEHASRPWMTLSDYYDGVLDSVNRELRMLGMVVHAEMKPWRSRNTDNVYTSPFFGLLVSLRDRMPDSFFESRDLDACKNEPDWHCSVAALLPYILSEEGYYFPDYLHSLLGVDLSDERSTHYFIGPRVILSVLHEDAGGGSSDSGIRNNLRSWTQMLLELTALQHRFTLDQDYALSDLLGRLPSAPAPLHEVLDKLLQREIDLDEFHNIRVSINPIFTRHLETLKHQSGITRMQASIREKFATVMELHVARERRAFARLASILAVLFGMFGVGSLTWSITSMHAKEHSLVLTSGSLVMAFLVGALLVRWIERKV